MKKLWERLTGIDRLRARIDYLEKVQMHTTYSLGRVSDLAYDRRTALRTIAACETPSANGTVKRMARIARDALATTHFADTVRDIKVEYIGVGQIDIVPGDVHYVIPGVTYGAGGGGGAGMSDWHPGEPGEIKIGRGVTAEGGKGGVSK